MTLGWSNAQPKRPIDAGELRSALLQRQEDSWFVQCCTSEHEVQTHEGLSGARGSRDECGGARPVAVLERVVECRDTGRNPFAGDFVRGDVADIGKAREHDQSAGSDAIDVVTGAEVAAPKLPDAEIAGRALSRSPHLETDDAVRDCELGRIGCFAGLVFADPQRRNGDHRQSSGEVMEEPAELGVVLGEGSQRLEAVDHDDAGTMLLQQTI